MVAASIHESFFLTHQEEDSSRLREALKILLEDNCKEVIVNLAERLDDTLKFYSNTQAVKAQQVKMIQQD